MSTSSKGKLEPQFRVSAAWRGPRNRQHFRYHCAPSGGEGGRHVQLLKPLPAQAPQPNPLVSPGAKMHAKGGGEEQGQMQNFSLQSPANNFQLRQSPHLDTVFLPQPGGTRSRVGTEGGRAVNCPVFLPLQEGMFSLNIPSPGSTNSPACT